MNVGGSSGCSWDGGPPDGAIEHRPKLADQNVKWSQVASDSGEDDGSLKRGDDQRGEIFRAFDGDAEFGQTLGERLEPAVECTTKHLAERPAGGRRICCGGH